MTTRSPVQNDRRKAIPDTGALDRFEEQVMPQQFILRQGSRAWGGISTPLSDAEFAEDPDFSPQLCHLRKMLKQSSSFLDVGCGCGEIMSYAKKVNPQLRVVGIDVRPAAAAQAKRYGEVICEDAFRYKGYGEFDLLYMFRPLVSFREQMMLEEHVIRNMKRGATLISLLPAHHLLLGVGRRGVFAN
jgi:SAM-dependent methyltransferase